MPDAAPELITKFIERWEKSGGSEKANYVLFLTELCDLLDVPRPDPASPETSQNRYTFERVVTHKEADGTTSNGFIDLYKAGAIVLETKQGTFAKAAKEGTLLEFLPTPAQQKSGHGKRGTAAFDKVLLRAYNQARKYITALPAADGRPPFLIVCDVGYSLDLYAEFTGTGGQYERFPDPISHRITLPDLHRPEIRERLRKVWTDPHSLDPSKHSAAVTREVAKALAALAKSLETDGHDPKVTAGFLQRCLFTLFAEDVGLLPNHSFCQLLEKLKDSPAGFPVMLHALWQDMATGSAFSTVLLAPIPHFNGGLFEDTTALPLRPEQMALLIHAAKSDWSAVEPAIFGTLVERALDPRERHKLGAHYTPRAYVERLVRSVLIDPLRDEWDAVKAAASLASEKAAKAEIAAAAISEDAKQHIQALDKAKAAASNQRHTGTLKQAAAHRAEAVAAVRDFHRKICSLRVLDPACGSGNFLYVCLELMKRLESEVLEAFEELGGDAAFEMASFKIGPRQFLGLEINRRAVAIAQLVLWIGSFQWQRKTTGKADTNERPLLPKEPSIIQQDAVLAYAAAIPRTDPDTGEIVSIWDGHSTKPHPITGKEVPDESARKVVFDYSHPRRAEWPAADVIVGNPPFIGASRMRDALGDGYTETLRQAWKGRVPESADFVMYWWHKAAELVVEGKAQRFGFITTNSIHQTFNRRVLESFLGRDGSPSRPLGASPPDPKNPLTVGNAPHLSHPLHLAYAISDHPWVDSADGAAVRIAMTVAAPGRAEGILETVIAEFAREDGENDVTLIRSRGILAPNLQLGADVSACSALLANSKLSCPGVKLHGAGFIISDAEAESLGLGTVADADTVIRGYRNGKDLTSRPRGVKVIDLFGLSETAAAARFPSIYQHVLIHVKPERDATAHTKDGAAYAKFWWLFGKPRADLRLALAPLPRYIATVETSKHRFFTFLDREILPDNMLIAIATDDAAYLGILSSQIHVVWALAAGGRLGMGNDPRYNKTRCFEPFPFPDLSEGPLKQRIRELGERLDAHRKTQQAAHPDLTLTGMYNVLEAVRAGIPLSAKDKAIHDKGLVSILGQIHDDLDAAVLDAYGWSDLKRGTGGPPVISSAAHGQAARAPLENAASVEQVLLTRLVALNHERAAEETRGFIRWVRPDYQCPSVTPATVTGQLGLTGFKHPQSAIHYPISLAAWPDNLAAQVSAIQKLIPIHGPDAETLAACFGKKSAKRRQQVTEILETLQGLGRI